LPIFLSAVLLTSGRIFRFCLKYLPRIVIHDIPRIPDLIGSVLQTSKRKDIVRLRDYNRRLKTVVSELLAKINELDQERLFSQTADSAFSQIISQSCEQLVTLGDALLLVEHQLDEGRLEESRRNILSSCTAANVIRHRLDQLQKQLRYRSNS
jgi:hypothetical protein